MSEPEPSAPFVVTQRRRLIVWRVAAIVAFVAAVAAVVPRPGHLHVARASGPHLVRLKITGLITQDADRITAIDDARRDATVKAMLLQIDSPGGTVGAGFALHDALARFAAAKPLVAVMGDTAASAAYMAAVPSARIFASGGTLTGSIGVLMQAPDFSGLLGKLGIGVDMMVSGPLKGQPSGVQPLSPAGRQMLQSIVDDYDTQFVEMVARGRAMPTERVRALADGRPYTGRQALADGLVDQLGDEAAARDWLAAQRHVPASLSVIALPRPGSKRIHRSWAWRLLHADDDEDDAALEAPAPVAGLLWRTLLPQTVRQTVAARLLNGPVALWQP